MPTNANSSRIGMSRLVLRTVLGAAALGALCIGGDANAQIAGTTSRPIPNVLLLVDTSGSMERMADNSLPSANRDPLTGGTLAARRSTRARRASRRTPTAGACSSRR